MAVVAEKNARTEKACSGESVRGVSSEWCVHLHELWSHIPIYIGIMAKPCDVGMPGHTARSLQAVQPAKTTFIEPI